ncbi:MAG TPA: tetratricopeptide repeat-containing protein [Pararhizobium sp.]|nr:tetratricopeptide repeat-containing protein [Pararhizobium sp.]
MSLPENPTTSRPLIGMSKLMRLAYDNADIGPIWNDLLARTKADPADAAAWMDISVLMLATGRREQALEVQTAAIALQPVYRRVFGAGNGPTVAAFVTAGDMMANTPVEFLLEGSNAVLVYVYIDAGTDRLPDLGTVDAAFMAIGQSPENEAVLANLEHLLATWKGPRILNGAPLTVAGLTRDGVHRLLAGEPSILSPATVEVKRDALLAVSQERDGLHTLLTGAGFPLVVRPAGTHAGGGMERIGGASELADYLARQPQELFYLSPFVDYAGPDGLCRKQRIVFIAGKPFASHCAVSGHWMEHFDADFAARHAEAFAALNRCIGLDYFGIDCAEMRDGRLLVFEVDVAMIVHDMDSEKVFPYKKPAMRKLFRAFQQALFDGCGKAAHA